jgi:hypothetical protein
LRFFLLKHNFHFCDPAGHTGVLRVEIYDDTEKNVPPFCENFTCGIINMSTFMS